MVMNLRTRYIMRSANSECPRGHGGFAMRGSSLKNEELPVPEGKVGGAGVCKKWWFAEQGEFAVMAPRVRATQVLRGRKPRSGLKPPAAVAAAAARDGSPRPQAAERIETELPRTVEAWVRFSAAPSGGAD